MKNADYSDKRERSPSSQFLTAAFRGNLWNNEIKTFNLMAIAGSREISGFNGLVNQQLD
jgi:hypothetical protein